MDGWDGYMLLLTWSVIHGLSVLVQVYGLLHVIRGLGSRLLLLLLLHTVSLYALLHSIDIEGDAAVHYERGKDGTGIAAEERVEGRDIAFG
jgi:hypothetical protein